MLASVGLLILVRFAGLVSWCHCLLGKHSTSHEGATTTSIARSYIALDEMYGETGEKELRP